MYENYYINFSLPIFTSSIRLVVAVDDTFLKEKFKGTLFIASALDGNNKLYHIAFGIGDNENDISSRWFLMKLNDAIDEVHNLVSFRTSTKL